MNRLEKACKGKNISNSLGGLNIPEFKQELKKAFKELGIDKDLEIDKITLRQQLENLCIELNKLKLSQPIQPIPHQPVPIPQPVVQALPIPQPAQPVVQALPIPQPAQPVVQPAQPVVQPVQPAPKPQVVQPAPKPQPAQPVVQPAPKPQVVQPVPPAQAHPIDSSTSLIRMYEEDKISPLKFRNTQIELYIMRNGPQSFEFREFLDWMYYVDDIIRIKRKHYIINKEKPIGHSISPRLNRNSYNIIQWETIPPTSMSITLSPYIEDETNRNETFVKLKTCSPKCVNSGIYMLSELTDMINISQIKHCIYCSENFDLFNSLQEPYGKMIIYNDILYNFIKCTFDMEGDNTCIPSYSGRIQNACIPFDKRFIIQSYLTLWLYIKGFLNSSIFTLSVSVTTGIYGIVFGSVHIKTEYTGDHGYKHYNPILHLTEKDGVLDRLILECASVGIFTPMFIDDMNDVFNRWDLCDKLVKMLNKYDNDLLLEYAKKNHKEISFDPLELIKSLLPRYIFENMSLSNLAETYQSIQMALQPFDNMLDDRLANVKDVIHKKDDNFTKFIPSYIEWNKFGYTQIIDIHHYPLWCNKDINYYSKSLLDVSTCCLNDDHNAILAFHGTIVGSIDSIHKKIDWTFGGGYLGSGFYFTLNPNEAKGYACLMAFRLRNEGLLSNSEMLKKYKYGVVFELIIRNAHNLIIGTDIKRHDKLLNQFNGQQILVDNIEIVRAHIMKLTDFNQPYNFITTPIANGGLFYYDTDNVVNLNCYSEVTK
jgi:hypothetical protein